MRSPCNTRNRPTVVKQETIGIAGREREREKGGIRRDQSCCRSVGDDFVTLGVGPICRCNRKGMDFVEQTHEQILATPR